MKTSSILGNYTNLMDNKKDSTSSCKTMILFYDIFQGRQIWKWIFCQEKIK